MKTAKQQQNVKWKVKDFLSSNRTNMQAILSEPKNKCLKIVTDIQVPSAINGRKKYVI